MDGLDNKVIRFIRGPAQKCTVKYIHRVSTHDHGSTQSASVCRRGVDRFQS